jgi:hypothetical protein
MATPIRPIIAVRYLSYSVDKHEKIENELECGRHHKSPSQNFLSCFLIDNTNVISMKCTMHKDFEGTKSQVPTVSFEMCIIVGLSRPCPAGCLQAQLTLLGEGGVA